MNIIEQLAVELDILSSMIFYPVPGEEYGGHWCNPIAQYLSRRLGHPVIVGYGHASILLVCSLPLPENVEQFLLELQNAKTCNTRRI